MNNGYAIAHDERAGMVHLEPASAVEFDREHAERLPLSEPLEDVGEVVRSHACSPRDPSDG
jgi:hypothetical protein